MFSTPAWRDVARRPADHLRSRPAEHLLGRRVPAHDPVVEPDLEDGHGRRLDRRPQARLARLELAHLTRDAIGLLYKVLPTAVVAAALRPSITRRDLESRCDAIIETVAAAAANMGVASGMVMGPSRPVLPALKTLVGGMPATRLTSMNIQNSTNCPGVRLVP